MRSALLVLCCGWLTLSGCHQPDRSTPAAAEVAAGSAVAATSVRMEVPALEERQGDQYSVRIERAPIEATHLALRRATELHLAQLRDQFIGQAMAAREEGFPFEQPWTLQLKMSSVLQRDSLLVLELEGSEFSGGAHALPLLATFVYLPPPADRLMAIEDWFDDDTVWKLISDAAIAELVTQFTERDGQVPDAEAKEWIAGGAGPDPANFAIYRPLLDDGDRIRAFAIRFQPYQVTSYADGMPAIELASTLFVGAVRSEFRDRFAP